ncbi:MAG: YlxR family protein [Actinomycetota bacterium]
MTPDPGRSPVRTCVGCRRRRPQSELRRYVADSAGHPRESRTAAGRGAWLCADHECLGLAQRNRAFERAWKVRLTRQSRRTMAN